MCIRDSILQGSRARARHSQRPCSPLVRHAFATSPPTRVALTCGVGVALHPRAGVGPLIFRG
eukprot:3732330-Alexandrium_andersonii.AAC.1